LTGPKGVDIRAVLVGYNGPDALKPNRPADDVCFLFKRAAIVVQAGVQHIPQNKESCL